MDAIRPITGQTNHYSIMLAHKQRRERQAPDTAVLASIEAASTPRSSALPQGVGQTVDVTA